ncbi:hypothetical protein ACH4TE_04855 [Streptomyces sioyaensis]|uniref:hypothetical protein n=1 Tax=Streptomyces sioyaensis TaxID=67364 RepID=UPI003788E9E5
MRARLQAFESPCLLLSGVFGCSVATGRPVVLAHPVVLGCFGRPAELVAVRQLKEDVEPF